MPATSQLINDIHTYIKDWNQAYGIEADYIKQWRNSRLTAGVSYTANRNRSTYKNLDGEVFHQRQDKAYFFAEYFHRINKVSLTGGLGAQYTSFLFKETNQGNHSWKLRPQATITYSPSQHHQFRLKSRFENLILIHALIEIQLQSTSCFRFIGCQSLFKSKCNHALPLLGK